MSIEHKVKLYAFNEVGHQPACYNCGHYKGAKEDIVKL